MGKKIKGFILLFAGKGVVQFFSKLFHCIQINHKTNWSCRPQSDMPITRTHKQTHQRVRLCSDVPHKWASGHHVGHLQMFMVTERGAWALEERNYHSYLPKGPKEDTSGAQCQDQRPWVHTETQDIPSKHQGTVLHCGSDWALTLVAKRGCGVSTGGNSEKKNSGRGPGQQGPWGPVEGGNGPDDLQKSLSTCTILWFSFHLTWPLWLNTASFCFSTFFKDWSSECPGWQMICCWARRVHSSLWNPVIKRQQGIGVLQK